MVQTIPLPYAAKTQFNIADIVVMIICRPSRATLFGKMPAMSERGAPFVMTLNPNPPKSAPKCGYWSGIKPPMSGPRIAILVSSSGGRHLYASGNRGADSHIQFIAGRKDQRQSNLLGHRRGNLRYRIRGHGDFSI